MNEISAAGLLHAFTEWKTWFVIAVTLVPALPRIIAVLAGEEEQPEPRLVLARRARIAVRPHPAATRLAVRLREAA